MPVTAHNHCIQLIPKSTPANKLPQWWSMLQRPITLKFNNKPVTTEHDLRAFIAKAWQENLPSAIIQFATVQVQPLHPTEGVTDALP